MAYLRELSAPRCSCGKPARVELVNRYNAPCGTFCRRCGERARRELERREVAAGAVISRPEDVIQ